MRALNRAHYEVVQFGFIAAKKLRTYIAAAPRDLVRHQHAGEGAGIHPAFKRVVKNPINFFPPRIHRNMHYIQESWIHYPAFFLNLYAAIASDSPRR
jgi:hypothetical protein